MSRAVIDQPGFRVVVIGVALSFFLGLALRSQISDARVQSYLDRAVSRLQSDFYVDYEYAKVNLSKWGLPFPVLEISRIRLSPKSTLCQSSQIYIDELEVPISISTLFGLSDKIPKIRLKEVELRFSDSSEKCIFQNKKTESAESAKSEPPQAQTPDQSAKAVFLKNTKAELKEIYIEKLKIIYAKKPEQPVLLRQVNVDLKYLEHRLVEVLIKSKINALKDLRSDFYFVNANLTFAIKAKSEKDIDSVLSIDGKLLDGDIQLFAHSVAGEQKVAFEAAVDKVSGKALLPFADSDLQLKTSLLEKIPISLSFTNAGEIYFGTEPGLEAHFKKVLINIENAQLRSNEIGFSVKAGKIAFMPFEMELDSLNLSRFKQNYALRGKLDSFDSLGTLSGKLSFKDEQHYHFEGLLQNVEAVFSNRSRRDLQNIDEISLRISREGDQLFAAGGDFVINNQRLESNFQVQHNLGDNSTKAQLKINNLSLNKKVWEQFTFVEQVPLVSLNWTFKKNQTETHNLKLTANSIALPGFKLDDISVDMIQVISTSESGNNLSVNLKPQKLSTNSKLLENEYINKIVAESLRTKNKIFISDKTSINLTGTNWKNLNFDLESVLMEPESRAISHLSFKGSTTQKEGLNSKIILTAKTSTYHFDFFTTPDSRLILNLVE